MDYATKEDVRNTATELREELRGEIRAVGVMVEHVASQISLVVEGQAGMREHMTEQLRRLREELSDRISLLEDVIREHSGEIADLRRRFDRFEDERELEKRVAAIEKRLRIR